MVRLRATRLKMVPRLSADGWHLLVRYMWRRRRRLDGTTQLLSNPENKPVKSSALLWDRLACFWSRWSPPPSLSTFHFWSQHEWVRLWFGCFYLSEWECGVKGGGGEGVDGGRPEQRSVQQRGLETQEGFGAQVWQEASEAHGRQQTGMAACVVKSQISVLVQQPDVREQISFFFVTGEKVSEVFFFYGNNPISVNEFN